MNNGNSVEIVKDSNLEVFAKWILEKTRDGKVVNEQQCANFLTTQVEGRIFEKDVKTWISRARKYSYSHLSQFIIKERGKGWRIAIGSDERENTCGRIVHLTAKHMDTGLLALNALKKQEVISLAKKLRRLKKMEKALTSTANDRASFEEDWINLTERIAERLESDEQKQIEAK